VTQTPLPGAVCVIVKATGPFCPAAPSLIVAVVPLIPVVLTVAANRRDSGVTVTTPVPVALLPEAGTTSVPVRVAANLDASESNEPPHAARRTKDMHVIHHAASHFLTFFMGPSP